MTICLVCFFPQTFFFSLPMPLGFLYARSWIFFFIQPDNLFFIYSLVYLYLFMITDKLHIFVILFCVCVYGPSFCFLLGFDNLLFLIPQFGYCNVYILYFLDHGRHLSMRTQFKVNLYMLSQNSTRTESHLSWFMCYILSIILIFFNFTN